MKKSCSIKSLLTNFLFLLVMHSAINAGEVFEVPLFDGGEILSDGKKGAVTIQYKTMDPEGVIAFYTREFAGMDDIKVKKTENSRELLIYDWGNRPWHRINVFSGDSGRETVVTITKDNWTWIIATLVIRFIGVFIVLLVVMIALLVSGKIFSIKKSEPETGTA